MRGSSAAGGGLKAYWRKASERPCSDPSHYRDASNFEVDMIVSLRDGRWGGVEVKLGAGQIDEAAENLLALKGKIDGKEGMPSFLMVLTGTEFAYRREDGVLVCPIGCLRH